MLERQILRKISDTTLIIIMYIQYKKIVGLVLTVMCWQPCSTTRLRRGRNGKYLVMYYGGTIIL